MTGAAPLAPRLVAGLVAVATCLEPVGVAWMLAGGTARALDGFASRPGDLDLEVDAPDLDRAAAALGLSARAECGGGWSSRRARGIVAGVELDLSAAVEVRGGGGRLAPDWQRQSAAARRARVAGRTVLLAPVEESLARALVLGDWPLLARIAGSAPPGAPIRVDYLSARLAAASAAR